MFFRERPILAMHRYRLMPNPWKNWPLVSNPFGRALVANKYHCGSPWWSILDWPIWMRFWEFFKYCVLVYSSCNFIEEAPYIQDFPEHVSGIIRLVNIGGAQPLYFVVHHWISNPLNCRGLGLKTGSAMDSELGGSQPPLAAIVEPPLPPGLVLSESIKIPSSTLMKSTDLSFYGRNSSMPIQSLPIFFVAILENYGYNSLLLEWSMY